MTEGGYRLIRSHRRSISLKVDHNGEVVVRADHGVGLALINEFVRRKRPWIKACQSRRRELYRLNPEGLAGLRVVPDVSLADSGRIVLIGKDLRYDPAMTKQSSAFEFYLKLRPQIKSYLYEVACLRLPKELERLSHRLELKYAGLKIRFSRTRWGSCRQDNLITLNSQLVRLPQGLITYVMIHELAHTRVKNHSKQYRIYLERLIKGSKLKERQLRRHFLLY